MDVTTQIRCKDDPLGIHLIAKGRILEVLRDVGQNLVRLGYLVELSQEQLLAAPVRQMDLAFDFCSANVGNSFELFELNQRTKGRTKFEAISKSGGRSLKIRASRGHVMLYQRKSKLVDTNPSQFIAAFNHKIGELTNVLRLERRVEPSHSSANFKIVTTVQSLIEYWDILERAIRSEAMHLFDSPASMLTFEDARQMILTADFREHKLSKRKRGDLIGFLDHYCQLGKDSVIKVRGINEKVFRVQAAALARLGVNLDEIDTTSRSPSVLEPDDQWT
ncbi:MAG: hypothetical protein KF824_11655 [Fimbriimonadaceae bacterium]|nr:MAG: hypothetical protein KF824_11655 [Fimbriimonadaceae bacterium]